MPISNIARILESWIDTHTSHEFYEAYGEGDSSSVYDYIEDHFDMYDSGCCRFVIYPEIVGWVIKFNRPGEVRFDYSENEYQNYCAAVKEGLDSFFVPTIFICERKGVKFYAQECVECDSDRISDVYYDSCENYFFENCNPGDNENYDIWEMVEDMDTTDRLYALFDGYTKLHELIEFCTKRDIRDLHAGNIGMRDGEYIIMDYASY